MSRLLLVVALAACGSVKNPDPVDFMQTNAFSSARFAQNDTEIWISQNDGNGVELAFASKLE